MQEIFKTFPALALVHHKDEDLKNVHISYVTRTNALPAYLVDVILKNYRQYALEFTREKRSSIVDIASLFQNKDRPVFIEIGFGDGENSFAIAKQNPNINYLAFDVYLYGYALYMKRISEAKLDNVILCRYDAEDFIKKSLQNYQVDGFNIFFPDPWIKRKQSKRRLINKVFVSLLASRLKRGGIIHLATDIREYADIMLSLLSEQSELKNLYDGFAPNKLGRVETAYEKKGADEQRCSYDIIFKKL